MLFDDTKLDFRGRWSYRIDERIPNEFHSFHQTHHSGDSATLHFTGTAIRIFGFNGPQNGLFNVTLDNVVTTLNGSTGAGSLIHTVIFYRGGLDPLIRHRLIVTNAQEAHPLSIDLVNVTSPSFTTSSVAPSTSSTPGNYSNSHNKQVSTGALITAILVPFICGLFILSLIFLNHRKQQQQQIIEKEKSMRYVRRSCLTTNELNISNSIPSSTSLFREPSAQASTLNLTIESARGSFNSTSRPPPAYSPLRWGRNKDHRSRFEASGFFVGI